MQVPQELLRVGFSRNIIEPQGTGANRVLIVGEAPGEMEDDYGIPFHPAAQAGSVVERAIRRIGMNREQFAITNVVPSRPPNNWLEGAPYYVDAVAWGTPQLEAAIRSYQPRAIVALGSVALRALTGLAGPKLGISHLTGYLLPSLFGPPVVPCFHPSYIRRGKMSHSSILMRVLRQAVGAAQSGRVAVAPSPHDPPSGYLLRPSLTEAEDFFFQCTAADTLGGWLAYDIETHYSNSEESAEEADAQDGREIKSIQFSLGPGQGIFFPWRDPYVDIARRLLGLGIKKAGWNNWRFDDPIIREHNIFINGEVHDLMWAWHHCQPDLPRGLQFAAAMQGPNITQPTHVWPYPWKHLDAANPEFYGIVDVDVLQWMLNYV